MNALQLGTAIKVEQIRSGVSGKELAERMGIHMITYYKVVNGMTNPTDKFLDALVCVLPSVKSAIEEYRNRTNGESSK